MGHLDKNMSLLVGFCIVSCFGTSFSSDTDLVKSNSTPSYFVALPFLRSNLIPEYFKGIILESRDWRNYRKVQELSLSLSPECGQHFQEFLSELRNNFDDISKAENWALKMIDSWGKPPEGVLSGHITALGDFDECLSVRQTTAFRGKYCTNMLLPVKTITGKVDQDLNLTSVVGDGDRDPRSISELLTLLHLLSKSEHGVYPTMASCLPSTCTTEEIQVIVGTVLAASELTDVMHPLTLPYCYTAEKPPLGTGAIVMIVVLLSLALLCIIGSILDLLKRSEYYFQEGNNVWWQVLVAFSVPKNMEKLLNTEQSPNSFHCLNGIRFISAVWVVLGHTFYMYILQPTWNLVDVVQAPSSSLFTLLILNGGLVVDTFLTMTGVLVSYNILHQLDLRHGKLNIFMLYLNRYLRLTPMYAMLIGISATLFPYFSSGPKWYVIEMWSQFCSRNWWHNLLYINNLDIYDSADSGSTNKQCFGEAWYLAVDMQLFLISPFLIYPLWRWRRVGALILSGFTLASITVPALVTYLNRLPPTALPFIERGRFTNESYMVPWMRAAPYMMGLWVGYFLHETTPYGTRKNSRISRIKLQLPRKLPRALTAAGWFVALASSAAVVLGIQKYFVPGVTIPRTEGAFYAGFCHAVWGLSVGWVIFACVRLQGVGWDWVNRFLSWKGFVPLGRLTYGIYLVSLNLQFLFHFGFRQPNYYGMYYTINIALAHITMSILVACLVSVTTESPFMELEKMFFRKKKVEPQIIVDTNRETLPDPQTPPRSRQQNVGENLRVVHQINSLHKTYGTNESGVV